MTSVRRRMEICPFLGLFSSNIVALIVAGVGRNYFSVYKFDLVRIEGYLYLRSMYIHTYLNTVEKYSIENITIRHNSKGRKVNFIAKCAVFSCTLRTRRVVTRRLSRCAMPISTLQTFAKYV